MDVSGIVFLGSRNPNLTSDNLAKCESGRWCFCSGLAQVQSVRPMNAKGMRTRWEVVMEFQNKRAGSQEP